MSFSVSYVGSVEGIKKNLAAQQEIMTGPSKTEFDAVLPALHILLDQNVGDHAIHLSANGHGNYDSHNQKTYGTVNVEIRNLGKLV
jgi:hypothetical protein